MIINNPPIRIKNNVSTENYYYITPVEGTDYGFIKTSDGYYTSTNHNVPNSVALCQINFVLSKDITINIKYINYSEATYDFGTIGDVGKTLDTNYSTKDDPNGTSLLSTNDNTSTEQSINNIQIKAGEENNFIQIKYRKDGATDSNNDSFKFKIENITSDVDLKDYGNTTSIPKNTYLANANDVTSGKWFIGSSGNYTKGTGSTTSNSITLPNPTISINSNSPYISASYTVSSGGTVTSGTRSSGDYDLRNYDTDLKPENIKSGVNIFGISGSYTGSGSSSSSFFSEFGQLVKCTYNSSRQLNLAINRSNMKSKYDDIAQIMIIAVETPDIMISDDYRYITCLTYNEKLNTSSSISSTTPIGYISYLYNSSQYYSAENIYKRDIYTSIRISNQEINLSLTLQNLSSKFIFYDDMDYYALVEYRYEDGVIIS